MTFKLTTPLFALLLLCGCARPLPVPTDPGDDDDDVVSDDDDTAGDDDTVGDDDDDDATPPWGDDDSVELYHSADYAGASVHGPDTLLQTEDCRECHGQDLTGGTSESSCDPCHQEGWRTDCIYCHGGELEDSGAPPNDLDGQTDAMSTTFIAHTSHVTQTNHAAWDCSECHVQPTDVLSVGHAFDDTPAFSEVDFTGGLGSGASYDDAGGCSNVYCHGDGRSGSALVEDDGEVIECSGCHADISSSTAAWSAMSGDHRKHLNDGMDCSDCHGSVVDGSQMIIQPALHVDGAIELTYSETTISGPASSCTGLCHWEFHFFKSWN